MSSQFSIQRRKMVDSQLRPSDVSDVAILDAMSQVAREEFVPAERRPVAYIDEDIEISPAGEGRDVRFLMEPTPFAKLLQLAEIRPDDVVLDIGCGTGYSSAVLSRLAGTVIALEEDGELAASAAESLSRQGFDTIVVVEGPLAEGYPSQAPYDVIVIEGAVADVPEALFAQLRDGGRLVAVKGTGNAATGTLFLRDGDVVGERAAFNAAVKELTAFRKAPAFRF